MLKLLERIFWHCRIWKYFLNFPQGVFVKFITSRYSRKFSIFGPVSPFLRQPSDVLESFLHLALYLVCTGWTRLTHTYLLHSKNKLSSWRLIRQWLGIWLYCTISKSLGVLSRLDKCPFRAMYVWPPWRSVEAYFISQACCISYDNNLGLLHDVELLVNTTKGKAVFTSNTYLFNPQLLNLCGSSRLYFLMPLAVTL